MYSLVAYFVIAKMIDVVIKGLVREMAGDEVIALYRAGDPGATGEGVRHLFCAIQSQTLKHV